MLSLDRRRALRNHFENRRRRPWPETTPNGDVVGVSVNYNRLDVTLQMLYSVYRVLDEAPKRMIIVDNGSTDGSVEFLADLDAAGLITLVRNRLSREHGPGLNRGVAEARKLEPNCSLVWLLDSDVFMVRPDTLTAASSFLHDGELVMCGPENSDANGVPGGYAHISCLLFDPRPVWRRPTPVFFDHGAPGSTMQRYLRRVGTPIDHFPFYEKGYVVHLGRATLQTIVAAGEADNPYYGWARDRPGHHYEGNLNGPVLHAAIADALTTDMPSRSARAFVAACRVPERIHLSS